MFTFENPLGLIDQAREHGMRLVILWFGLWKNGESTYVPEWVKADTKRFIRACYPGGVPSETISPLCQEAVEADKRAFTKFMEFLKEKTKKPRPCWQFRWKMRSVFRIGQRLFSSGRNCLPETGTGSSGSGRCFLGSPVRRRCSGNVYGMALRQCSRDHCVSRKTGVSPANVCECLVKSVPGPCRKLSKRRPHCQKCTGMEKSSTAH